MGSKIKFGYTPNIIVKIINKNKITNSVASKSNNFSPWLFTLNSPNTTRLHNHNEYAADKITPVAASMDTL